MLDDDQPIDEQITKDDVDDSDIEYEEDDDQGDSTKLTDLVNSLDPSARKSYKADASMDDDGFVAGQNSEFRVPADGNCIYFFFKDIPTNKFNRSGVFRLTSRTSSNGYCSNY